MPKRFTRQTLGLLDALLTAPAKQWYGLELMELTSLSSGTIYPLLHRLERDGWLTATREDVEPVDAGRPRRRLYRLTGSGEAAGRRILEDRQPRSEPTSATLRPGLASA